MGYFDRLYADTSLTASAKAVYLYLHDRAGKSGSCWPGIRTIGNDLNLSRSSVKRALKELEKSGYIRKEFRYRQNGSHTSNLYTLL